MLSGVWEGQFEIAIVKAAAATNSTHQCGVHGSLCAVCRPVCPHRDCCALSIPADSCEDDILGSFFAPSTWLASHLCFRRPAGHDADPTTERGGGRRFSQNPPRQQGLRFPNPESLHLVDSVEATDPSDWGGVERAHFLPHQRTQVGGATDQTPPGSLNGSESGSRKGRYQEDGGGSNKSSPRVRRKSVATERRGAQAIRRPSGVDISRLSLSDPPPVFQDDEAGAQGSPRPYDADGNRLSAHTGQPVHLLRNLSPFLPSRLPLRFLSFLHMLVSPCLRLDGVSRSFDFDISGVCVAVCIVGVYECCGGLWSLE